MKRTPLKRSGYKLKRTPIRQISKKQAARNKELAKIPYPADGRCQNPLCRRLPDFRGLAKHHKVMRSHGGSDKPDNLIWVCAKCHSLFHGIAEHGIEDK